MAEKIDMVTVAYFLGVLSIIFAFFIPIAGLVLGVVGLVQSRKQNFAKGKKINTIGIVLSVLLIVISIVASILAAKAGVDTSGIFPI